MLNILYGDHLKSYLFENRLKNGMIIFKRVLGLELVQAGSIGEICHRCGALGSCGKGFSSFTDCYDLKPCLVNLYVFINVANHMKAINILEGKHQYLI
jgi:hypothetical protein